MKKVFFAMIIAICLGGCYTTPAPVVETEVLEVMVSDSDSAAISTPIIGDSIVE